MDYFQAFGNFQYNWQVLYICLISKIVLNSYICDIYEILIWLKTWLIQERHRTINNMLFMPQIIETFTST